VPVSKDGVHPSEPKTPEVTHERLIAYVVCLNPECGYAEGFADLRDSPSACPRCGGELVRECATCHMILRSPASVCTNCGRPIGVGGGPQVRQSR
jgi:predicted RNA-binding Zn-ribbon protein involved in translation (DUF1610 family)